MSSAGLEDLQTQKTELSAILRDAANPNLKQRLEVVLHDIDQALREAAAASVRSSPAESAREPSPAKSTPEYAAISKFAWDQNDKNVKVYLLSGVDGVQDLPEGAVSLDCTKDSFDLKITGLAGKNYRLLQSPLDKEIDPAASKFKVKKNRVTVFLRKADKWSHFTSLVDKTKAAKAGKSGKAASAKEDPGAGIMDMMKKMYDEGDDDMKRTIAKAFTESRNRQTTGQDPYGSGTGSGAMGGLGGAGGGFRDDEDDDLWGSGGGALGGVGKGKGKGKGSGVGKGERGGLSGAAASVESDLSGAAEEGKEDSGAAAGGGGGGIKLDPETLH